MNRHRLINILIVISITGTILCFGYDAIVATLDCLLWR